MTECKTREKQRTANIVLAIVGLTFVNSTFVLLSGICANVGLTFFKCLTSGMVNVQLPVAEQIFLFNGIGSMVLSQNGVSGLNTISVGHLGRGIYYLRAGNETVKILIQ